MGPPSPSLSRRASRPLPSPLSFTGACPSYCRGDPVAREDLPRQGDIGLRAFAFAIELHGGSAEAPGPSQPYGARNNRVVHLLAQRFLPLPPPPLRPPIAPAVQRSGAPFGIRLWLHRAAELLV